MKKITIIGGGLAGLITSIQAVRAGIQVELYEKKSYPFHRVCGEYISNETIPFLKSLGLFPSELNPTSISKFQLTSVNGKAADLNLDLGGFGISRYTFDNWLYEKARSEGVLFHLNHEVDTIQFSEDKFQFQSQSKRHETDFVIGAFGKRSKVDIQLSRSFVKKRSPYVGVKYHIRTEHPNNLIALHNFQDGYCGISNVENGISNLCYLTHRKNLKSTGSIKTMEEQILFQNPYLKSIFNNSEFLFDQPETINEISFETKQPVESHILMCGDAAGMITPLCGNGMAMAIHSSKILSELLIQFCKKEDLSRSSLEAEYTKQWKAAFASRLRAGRLIQRLFGSPRASNLAVAMASNLKPVANFLMSKTHGSPF